jgi:DNA-directed RNA polymerase specialized sigma subunit
MADAIGYSRPELRTKILHMERELDRDVDHLLKKQVAIERRIRTLPDERARTVLELRYLTHLSWEAIGERMFMDVRWAQRLHNRAIAQLRIPEAELELVMEREAVPGDLS